jgi:O-antigen/teichoic acid export membrane protein
MGATMVLTYLFQVVMARWLSILEYGELSTILATLNVLTIPIFGLCMAITRDVAAARVGGTQHLAILLRPYAIRVASVTVAVIAGVLVLSSWLQSFLQLSSLAPLVFLALLVTFTNVLGTSRAVLLGLHDFASVAANQISEALIRLICATAIAAYGLPAMAGFGGYLLGLSAALCLVAWRVPMRVGPRLAASGPDPDSSAQVVVEAVTARTGDPDISWPAIVVTGTFIVLLNVDLIVVKHFLPPDLAGQYAAISMLAKALFVITNAFDVVLFPFASAARAAGADDSAHLQRALLSVGSIVIPILAVYWFTATPLVDQLFGARYAGVAPLLFPYALAVTLLGIGTLIARYRLAVGRGVSSRALLATAAAATAAFVAFHATLEQVVGVLLVTGIVTVALGLSGARRRG